MSAMRQAEKICAALGEAQVLAVEAMNAGRVRNWAQQNLLECWLFYCRCTRIGGVSLYSARRQLRAAISAYRGAQ